MEFGDSKGHLSEERVPCPWDTTRGPEDLSREMSERVKEDVVDHHASKIDRVRNNGGHKNHPGNAEQESHDRRDKTWNFEDSVPNWMWLLHQIRQE